MGSLKFIYKNLDHFKARFVFVFVAGMLDGFAIFFIPVLLAEFTKQELTFSNFQKLLYSIVLLYAASLLFQWIIRRYGEALSLQFGNHIRLKYFKMLERMPMKDLINHHSGYILSLINKVSDGMTPILFDVFWTFAKSISNVILFFYFTAQESFSIAVFNLIILSFFIFASTLLSRKIVSIAGELNKKRASLMESYADFISNMLTIKRLGIYPFAEDRLFQKTDDNYKQIQKLQNFHANRWFLLHGLFGVAYLSTIGFILFQITSGIASASVLILFVAAYAVIMKNVERLSESLKSLMEMKAYIENLDKIISFDDLTDKNCGMAEWEDIKFKDVFFQYPGTDKKISIPDFHIKKGEKICLVGKSGEGKTTFLNLFANFIIPEKGDCLVDSHSYEKISRKFFQDRMAMISQEIELFNMSLRENIMLGQSVKEENIFEILEKFDLLDWIQNLDEGMETIVGEKGIKLSAGQKQRINLIRGVVLDHEILLLDEPTSHLDAVTEKKIVEFLKKYLSGRTAIIVSHREELKTICDRCYVIEDRVMKEC